MTSAQSGNPPPTLSFPRPIFAALSPHPFLRAHLTSSTSKNKSPQPTRANGRTASEFRQLGVNTGSLTHCNGSAVVRMGNTAVVCGVRAELLKADDITSTEEYELEAEEDDGQEIADLRLLVPNVELSTGSTPQLIPGNAPSTFAQTLVTRIRNLLFSTRLVRAKDLRILYTPSSNPEDPDEEPEKELKGYWVLYIDTLFISLDGNAFDAAWLAILAALRDTLLPHAYFDEEFEAILCSDAPSEARKLDLRGLPVPSRFAVFEGRGGADGEEGEDWMLSDPDAFEESVCRESVCLVIDCSDGKKGAVLRKIEKSGGGVVDRDVLKGLVKRATERWGVWEKVLNGKE